MKAVIVAAGRGKRMGNLTDNIPKPLLKLGKDTLISRSVKILKKNRIDEIYIVVGYLKEKIEEALGSQCNYIFNPFWKTTNNMLSLWFAKPFVRSRNFLYLHGDLVYEKILIRKILHHKKGDLSLLVDHREVDREAMKVKVKNGKLIESKKEIPIKEAYGEWIGITYFSKQGSKAYFDIVDTIASDPETFRKYDTFAFTSMARNGLDVRVVNSNPHFWKEIDFGEDYLIAKDYFSKHSNF